MYKTDYQFKTLLIFKNFFYHIFQGLFALYLIFL